MSPELRHDLLKCDTDIDGALSRFSDNEALYLTCLKLFLDDPTMNELESAIHNEAWDDAFTAVHALKGLAGNMGFIPLFQAAAKMVIIVRAGRLNEMDEAYKELDACYAKVISAIRGNMVNMAT